MRRIFEDNYDLQVLNMQRCEPDEKNVIESQPESAVYLYGLLEPRLLRGTGVGYSSKYSDIFLIQDAGFVFDSRKQIHVEMIMVIFRDVVMMYQRILRKVMKKKINESFLKWAKQIKCSSATSEIRCGLRSADSNKEGPLTLSRICLLVHNDGLGVDTVRINGGGKDIVLHECDA
jgi:hypothetical protein